MTSWGVGPKFAFASLLMLLALIVVNFYFVPELSLPFSPLRVFAGVVLIFLGVAVCVAAAFQVHKAFNQRKLLTSGVFAYVRNPVYAAFIWLIAPAMVLVTGFLLLVVLPFAMYGLIRVLIVEEDRYLEQRFGQEYIDYKKRVNAVVPSIPAYHASQKPKVA